MNATTFWSILQQIEFLFPEEQEDQPDPELEWSEPDTERDDGIGMDAEDAYAYWNED